MKYEQDFYHSLDVCSINISKSLVDNAAAIYNQVRRNFSLRRDLERKKAVMIGKGLVLRL